jgi:YebC/PmpR family DNA-binding regulatory protein
MSGHSKWATIKRKKGALDAKRGQLFSKLIREITVAAREGGADPDNNAALKTAIARARAANMPSETVSRAVTRGSGAGEGSAYERMTYEGYGPLGIAVMVDVLTDNKNRTVSDIRHIFARHGGNLGGNGCVSWMFERRGQIVMKAPGISEETLLDWVVDSGADDFKVEGDTIEVYTPPPKCEAVRSYMAGKKAEVISADVTMVPKTLIEVTDEKEATRLLKLLDALEDHDDVQRVYANWDMSEELLAKVSQ